MGRVIANATVLSNFAIIKRLDILKKAVANLYTTREVIEEIKFGIWQKCSILLQTVELVLGSP